MTKDEAQAIFDRLDAAELAVSMRKKLDWVSTTTFEDAEPRRAPANPRYVVVIDVESIRTPDQLRTIADAVSIGAELASDGYGLAIK